MNTWITTRHRGLCACTTVFIAGFAAGCGGPNQGEIARAIGQTLDSPAFAVPDGADEEVHEFYAQREMRPAWVSGRGLNGRGRRVVAVLDSAARQGLRPARYAAGEVGRLIEAIDRAESDESAVALLAALDIRITTGYRTYLGDVDAGAIEPRPEAMDRPLREPSRLAGALDSVARGEDPAAVASSFEPADGQYARLVLALGRYMDIARQGGWPAVLAGAGHTKAATAVSLRSRLIAGGDPRETELALAGAESPTIVDDRLVEALRLFQRRHGLEPTGEVDDATLVELNTPVEERIATLTLNLDRWRAMPRSEAPLRVLVNIPAFRMVVLEGGDSILGMKVVVGAVAHPTPVMVDTMEYVVTNPYWNVPASILTEEIAPAVAADEDYLRARNMELVMRGEPSRLVDPRSIDWDELHADSIAWMVRQRPGPGNALGKVKFLFPNDMDIYLHDTPETSAFDRTARALSHGCVRLEQPLELARLVLERRAEPGQPALDELLAMEGEKHIPLEEGIPVHIVYLTASADEDGTVRFHRDLYGRDDRLRDQVAARLFTPERPTGRLTTD